MQTLIIRMTSFVNWPKWFPLAQVIFKDLLFCISGLPEVSDRLVLLSPQQRQLAELCCRKTALQRENHPQDDLTSTCFLLQQLGSLWLSYLLSTGWSPSVRAAVSLKNKNEKWTTSTLLVFFFFLICSLILSTSSALSKKLEKKKSIFKMYWKFLKKDTEKAQEKIERNGLLTGKHRTCFSAAGSPRD